MLDLTFMNASPLLRSLARLDGRSECRMREKAHVGLLKAELFLLSDGKHTSRLSSSGACSFLLGSYPFLAPGLRGTRENQYVSQVQTH